MNTGRLAHTKEITVAPNQICQFIGSYSADRNTANVLPKCRQKAAEILRRSHTSILVPALPIIFSWTVDGVRSIIERQMEPVWGKEFATYSPSSKGTIITDKVVFEPKK